MTNLCSWRQGGNNELGSPNRETEKRIKLYPAVKNIELPKFEVAASVHKQILLTSMSQKQYR